MQGTCVFGTGCRGARLLVWLILNDRVQPSLIAGVYDLLWPRPQAAAAPAAPALHARVGHALVRYVAHVHTGGQT